MTNKEDNLDNKWNKMSNNDVKDESKEEKPKLDIKPPKFDISCYNEYIETKKFIDKSIKAKKDD